VLRRRILSGCLIVAALVVAAQRLPLTGVWLLIVLVSSLGQIEFYAMIKLPGIPTFRILGLICGAALISATFLTLGTNPADVARAYRWEHLVLLASLIGVFVRQFPQKHNEKPLTTVGCTLMGILYVPYLFNYFTRLILSWNGPGDGAGIGQTGRLLTLYLVLVVKSTDIGAYFTGRFLGRHKLLPRISPGKTWEGCFGGVATAVLASCLFCHFAGQRIGSVDLPFRHAVILAILLAVAGVVGDMFESLLKRASGAKDSSSAIPGMGGVLDVLDSLLFGVPVLYMYAWLFL